jgi:NAD(P)H dehydrogenase (quinone)
MCHPRQDSLTATLAEAAATTLRAAGHELRVCDLYEKGFQPALAASEHRNIREGLSVMATALEAEMLQAAELLVLVFPTWWFGMPAMLKGWFDRVWVPGIAYDLVPESDAMLPHLRGLKRTIAVTTLGSPWWVDRLVLRQPLRRILKRAILGPCAPQAKLDFLSFYNCDKLTPQQVDAMRQRVAAAMARV